MKKYRHNNTPFNVKPQNKVVVNILEMENYKQRNYCATLIPKSISKQTIDLGYVYNLERLFLVR